jgi:hypothetical protein
MTSLCDRALFEPLGQPCQAPHLGETGNQGGHRVSSIESLAVVCSLPDCWSGSHANKSCQVHQSDARHSSTLHNLRRTPSDPSCRYWSPPCRRLVLKIGIEKVGEGQYEAFVCHSRTHEFNTKARLLLVATVANS